MKNTILIIFILITNFVFSQNVIVDETYFDNSFRLFKIKFECAVNKKDTKQLHSFLNNRIGNGMMDYYSKDVFFVNNDSVWDRLNIVLKYGFHLGYRETLESLKDSSKFTAPSYLKAINLARENGKNRIAILVQTLNVREKPSLNSKIISTLSYQLIEPVFDENYNIKEIFKDGIQWLNIMLSEDKYGFIDKKFTSEFRFNTLVVSKIENEWKITEFYGDTRKW